MFLFKSKTEATNNFDERLKTVLEWWKKFNTKDFVYEFVYEVALLEKKLYEELKNTYTETKKEDGSFIEEYYSSSEDY